MKYLVALLCAVLTTSVMADEEVVAGVVDRMTCADIQERISELSSEEEPDDSVLEEIAKLKADYRRSCTKSAGGRRTAAASRVIVEATDDEEYIDDEEPVEDIEEVAEEEVVQEVKKPKKKTKKKTKKQSDESETQQSDDVDADESAQETEEDLKAQLEQELANLNSGLCADGAKPNKYGCCGDEIFKDMGNMVFACCPKSGGDCFPPIQ